MQGGGDRPRCIQLSNKQRFAIVCLGDGSASLCDVSRRGGEWTILASGWESPDTFVSTGSNKL